MKANVDDCETSAEESKNVIDDISLKLEKAKRKLSDFLPANVKEIGKVKTETDAKDKEIASLRDVNREDRSGRS